MDITVKFVDYGNEISVSKVDPRCGRSVASAVWTPSQATSLYETRSVRLLNMFTVQQRMQNSSKHVS